MIALRTRTWLLATARRALAEAVARPDLAPPFELPPPDPCLEEPARVFVSCHVGERLVGCIGTLRPELTLAQAVAHYAVQAGLRDPRVEPMDPSLLGWARLEISVLSEPRALEAVGLEAIANTVAPGRDGVVLHKDGRRGVFLPSVWSSLTDAREFLRALCRKAGIDPERDGEGLMAQVFTAETWSEPEST